MSKRSRVVAIGGALLIAASSVPGVFASSHREAPLISGDPSADNTDLYAFVSPNDTSKLTIIANYIPLQQPAGGPNFHPFDSSVRYRIHIDNNGDAKDDVTYTIRFRDRTASGRDGVSSFLYNNGPLTTVTDPNWLAPQEFTVQRTKRDDTDTLGSRLRTVPANVGRRSNPDYAALAATGVHSLRNGGKAYAGPRDDAFFADLGSIFDLAGLRPFNTLHAISLPVEKGVDGVAGYNTASIVLQVPISEVRRSTSQPVVGVWASADRRETRRVTDSGHFEWSGDWTQVSRLGNPLINEVVIPRHLKDYWNSEPPSRDKQFLKYYEAPEVTALEKALYAALDDPKTTGRTDLSLILLKGVPGVNALSAKPVLADMLRVNTAIKPGSKGACPGGTASAAAPNRLAVLEGDVCGFPNGRRLVDDVIDINLRAFAEGYGTFLNGAFGLPNRTPNNLLGDGIDTNADKPFLAAFPYIGLPHSGYEAVPPVRGMLP